jgi:hypothetical protein
VETLHRGLNVTGQINDKNTQNPVFFRHPIHMMSVVSFISLR